LVYLIYKFECWLLLLNLLYLLFSSLNWVVSHYLLFSNSACLCTK